ncbi:TBC1 domain family member 5 homolog A isoform X1 [Rhagoletis pomonella]|uniref:TBC1 domain family member 5 homolog A isoform X1 n=1 Tax=Rhagoletis pomonella TaxID=28610 RepID=UPI0017810750|nr:TBC1 domain family member 5 homolog A isoform X1 [Rhagoletis pomonella]XP_036330215.1 TBC1 domain family member 5 homolog A isoform X1 [Rhagoletis pomonella]
MAPFKLKFRMGGSRSTSQEHEADPQVNEALLNHHQHHSATIGASSSTIDSTDCTSLGSMGTNERKSLLPNKSNNLQLEYNDPRTTTCNDESSTESNIFPTTPPSNYDHMLEELKVITRENGSNNGRRDSLNNSSNNILLSSLEHLSLSDNITIQCTDPNCQEIYMCNEQLMLQRQQNSTLNERNNFNEFVEQSQTLDQSQLNNEFSNSDDECEDDNRKESIDSTELLISTKMAAPIAASATQNNSNSMENDYRGDCEQCETGNYSEECTDECNTSNNGQANNGINSNDFFDPLINHRGYCSGENHYNQESCDNQMQDDYQGERCNSDSDDGWSRHQQMSNSQSHQQQLQTQSYEYGNQNSAQERSITPEIISNKSSKEIYKDLAKQWGITCKMSDACRCMECQGHYFDCEFDDNDHQKTDGGLGAGTPMFISEVMHGSACNIL